MGIASGDRGTPILYEHPLADRLDPFDADRPEPQWFINASGFTYATADLDALIDWPAIEATIPMGYKAIVVYQKIAVIQGGAVLREWRDIPLEADHAARHSPFTAYRDAGYVIIFQRVGLPYYRGAYSSRGPGSGLTLDIPSWAWSTRRLDHALSLSRGMDGPLLVARPVCRCDWH